MTQTKSDRKNLLDAVFSPEGGKSRAVYFIGIGGIGMSALARYFRSKGVRVSGYDKTETDLTKQLIAEGIGVHYTEDVNAAPKDVDLVVYTPAVPKEQAELVFYQNNGYTVVKRSDVLQAISESSFNVCIGGTHGKTTITTMVAHILRHSGYGCNAFLGGISVNYGTNFWSSENNVCVIEADEYDRSFLKLSPDIAVITAMDADHLDIYGDEESLQDAFVQFAQKVKEGGLLIYKFGLPRLREARASSRPHPNPSPRGEGLAPAQPSLAGEADQNTTLLQREEIETGNREKLQQKIESSQSGQRSAATSPLGEAGGGRWTYSLQNEAADVFAANIKIDEGGYRFDVHTRTQTLFDCELRVGGMHNVENAVAAVAVASVLEIDGEKIKAALAAFKGVRRRFEYVLPPKKQKQGGHVEPVLVDDYAHHPEELRALLTSVRSLFPQRVVTVVFQPHLFTRTRDLAEGFADALSLADRVILLPIYPARELPIEGVSSEMILKKIDREDKQVLSKEALLAWMKTHAQQLDKEFGEVIVMAGAGDIDALVAPVKEILRQ